MYFLFSFTSKLTLVASISHICKYEPFCNHLCDYKSFLPSAIKNSYIYNGKNGWFGHKSQTHGLKWTRFLLMFTSLTNTTLKGWKHNQKDYLDYHSWRFFELQMNLKYKAIFNINIIQISNIHVTIYFNGNHIKRYRWIPKTGGLIMDFGNDDIMFVTKIEWKMWTKTPN
jgi:hypothetical protein